MSNFYEPVLRAGKFELEALSAPTIQGELGHYHVLSSPLEGKRFLGATLTYLNAAATMFLGCRFTDTYLFRANLNGVVFRYCHFDKIKFHECDWRDVQFVDCIFEDTEFARPGEETAVAAQFDHCDFNDPFEKLNGILETGSTLFTGCSFLNREIPAALRASNEFFIETLAIPAKATPPATRAPQAPTPLAASGIPATSSTLSPVKVATSHRFDGIEIHEDKPGPSPKP